MTYKVALIGGGNMGGIHGRHWHAMPGAEVVAVLDSKRKEVRITGDPPLYSDWQTMWSQARPDIVDICTPTPQHREYIELAAAAGVAIFSEKPLSRTIADCDAIVSVVEKSGVPFMSGHVVRYFPEFAAANRIVNNGGIGKPLAVRTARMGGFPGLTRPNNWYGQYDESGGVVLDLILHDFDWLRWCFGDVERVFAKGLYQSAELQGKLDYALVTLRFKSGAVGHVTGSWAHPSGFRTTFEIAGDAGVIDHDSARSVPLTIATRSTEPGAPAGGVAVPKSPMASTDDPYYRELSAFVNALASGTPPPVTVYDAREAVRIALSAITSIETGKAVTL